MIKNIFVLLHIITAAGWFGLGLSLSGLSRKAVDEGGSAILATGAKAVGMMTTFVSLTLVFGLIAFFAGGGFGSYGPAYHTSITLLIILVLVQLFIIRPGWAAVEAGGGQPARKKVAMGTGIGHLLWLVVLILMLWTQYPLF